MNESKYQPPYDDELIAGTTTEKNRIEINSILAEEEIQKYETYLAHLKESFAKTASPRIGRDIARIEDMLARMKHDYKEQKENVEGYRKQVSYPFKPKEEQKQVD